jgi:hypothetical protein
MLTFQVLNTLFQSGFDKDDFLLADVRSLTTLLETCIKQGQGTVGWGMRGTSDPKLDALTISSPKLPSGCGRYGKDYLSTASPGLGPGS